MKKTHWSKEEKKAKKIVKINLVFSCDSVIKLKKRINQYTMKESNLINQHNFQGSLKNYSDYYCINNNEEAKLKNKDNNISFFGIKNLRIKEIEKIQMNNEIEKKAVVKAKRLEDYPKIHRFEIIQSLDKMLDFPQIEDNMITKYQIYLDNLNNISNKKTLLLDLDETLIYCLYPNEKYDNENGKNLKVPFVHDSLNMTFIKRPFLNEFLEFVTKYYEVLVFITRYILQVQKIIQVILFKKLILIINLSQKFYPVHYVF